MFTARKATSKDQTTQPFVVEHESGQIVATCSSWREAMQERDRLAALQPA